MKEIILEKNAYIQVSEFCILANLQIWGKPDEYTYVLAIKNYPKYEEYYCVYGKGESPLDALLDGIKNFSECAMQSISFDALNDMTLIELSKELIRKEGNVVEPEIDVLPISHICNGEEMESNCHVLIENNCAYPILT